MLVDRNSWCSDRAKLVDQLPTSLEGQRYWKGRFDEVYSNGLDPYRHKYHMDVN